MYNEVAEKRHRLLAEAYEHLDAAREAIYDAIYDEYDHSVTQTMEQWADNISEVIEALVPHVNEPENEADIADEFLYGRM